MMTVRLRVTGTVQGVGYREWTRRQAALLDLKGWVRNEPDGSVLALVAGQEFGVWSLITRMWEGPQTAAVRAIVVERTDDRPEGAGFRVSR